MLAFIKNCSSCQKQTLLHTIEPPVPIYSHQPFERLVIDLIDFKSLVQWNDDMKWCLTIVDHFSDKYVYKLIFHKIGYA